MCSRFECVGHFWGDKHLSQRQCVLDLLGHLWLCDLTVWWGRKWLMGLGLSFGGLIGSIYLVAPPSQRQKGAKHNAVVEISLHTKPENLPARAPLFKPGTTKLWLRRPVKSTRLKQNGMLQSLRCKVLRLTRSPLRLYSRRHQRSPRVMGAIHSSSSNCPRPVINFCQTT